MAKTYLLLTAHDFIGQKEFDSLRTAKTAARQAPTNSEVDIIEQGDEDQLVAVWSPANQMFTFDLAAGRATRPRRAASRR